MAPRSKMPEVAVPQQQRGKRGLTDMQKAFCEHIAAEHNQSEAMRLAGSQGTDQALAVTASRWLRLAKVQDYLKTLPQQRKAAAATAARIATAQERQELWTAIMRGEGKSEHVLKDGSIIMAGPDWSARLKALEALGRAQGDFIKDSGAQAPQIKIVLPSGPMTPEQIASKRQELWGGADDNDSTDAGT